MPVAGMAYLDRPQPGGYFIFPDLSVRHEGKFRLSFNLYEELKEAKDEDAEPARPKTETKDVKPPQGSGTAPKNHAAWRLEVKSIPFSVFSAKKFPGLAESTTLSRVVAEQGCRVRIRRDVRMRRRDNKSKDYEDYEENGYARTDRFGTPAQQIPERPRSISNSSMHGSVHGSVPASVEPSTPYAIEHRRSSQDLGYSYTQPNFAPPPAPAQPVQTTPAYPSHLTFGATSSQYAAPSFQPPSAPLSQPSQRYVPTGNDYQYQANAHSRQMSASQNFAYSPSQPQTPTYQQSQTPIYPNSATEYKPVTDYRRVSLPPSQQTYSSQPMNTYNQPDSRPNTAYAQVEPRQTAYAPADTRQNPAYSHVDTRQGSTYPQVDSRHNPVPSSYYAPTGQNQVPRTGTPSSNGHILPPIQTIHSTPENKYESYTPTLLPAPTSAPASSSSYENLHSKFQPTYTSAPVSTNTYDPTITGKRTHEQVFDNSHLYQPVHDGMRPATYNHGQDVPQVETDEGTLEDEYSLTDMKQLIYRRADGSKQSKKCPSPVID